MTENSMFFSDGSWYTQNMFARFISDIFGEGVVADIDDELEVSANSPANMAVQVKTGRSYVKGYIHEILTDPVQLTISDADTTNPRIDRIVLRLDVSTNRRIRVAVLEGTAAASPVAPTLTQTSSVWEISLAQVYVSANATVINSGNITDERTYMTMQRANMPLASSTAVGSVKIGDGISVSSGVISVPYTAYPMTARMYTEDQNLGTLISNNVYNGTVGQLPMGIALQNSGGSTSAKTFTVNYSMSNSQGTGNCITGTVTATATNCLTGATRVVGTASQCVPSASTVSGSFTIELMLEETVSGSVSGTYIGLSSFTLSSTNNTYLGRPTT